MSWKLGEIPTQGRCCNKGASPLKVKSLATEKLGRRGSCVDL